MIALLIATEFELKNQNYVWEDFEGLAITYINDGLCAIIVGAGVAKVSLSLIPLTEFKEKNSEVIFINLGIAGNLADRNLAQAYMPGKFIFNTYASNESPTAGFIEACYPGINLYQGPTLATSAMPIWEARNKDFLSKKGAELVDMEAYILASWAKQYGLTVYFIKVISDLACEESKQNFEIGALRAIEIISHGIFELDALISASIEVNSCSIKKCFGIKS
ncbi:hypothetical protein PQO03_03280 [Lentisphaera profundi]|uniref:Nucleoside phosphorylase domain-containing protein n=1 Tax=Lentisphaera profundi TaxID=1658616 RepID=A0ABY7VTD4_9BACT|nr:hypothetical protein [Lentisphaera profundi]WDE96982.1 hypothetical protein PQO03_03280 [Lentisphaera profundi]